jgi:hypothetical protein
MVLLALGAMTAQLAGAQQSTAAEQAKAAAWRLNLPPQVVQAERFLARRGWTEGGTRPSARGQSLRRSANPAAAQALSESQVQPQAQSLSGATWQRLGPTAVQSQNFGLVTGRISALALDPSDSSGNTLYVGTTGGGVWKSQNANAASPANITFTPLTDDLSALNDVIDTSISIGAVSVQPGGTGVILAGTGDPNDALDSYYGAGILRSTDGGTTWKLIRTTADFLYSFAGEGFAGFAWGNVTSGIQACGPNPPSSNVVVAAVSQAREGKLVNAVWLGSSSGGSYEGLYYSTDSGQNWCLATVTDGSGADVQGPADAFVSPDGNAATSVVWNSVRNLFIAAIRYHGYYQSSDGITWTRMTDQPGANLMASANLCPTNPGLTGSTGCPIFRGALAVNPTTGDTFAWTVDEFNQDQGIWQDVCAPRGGYCASTTLTFAQQWNTAALEQYVQNQGGATIVNGDYNLALAAVPSGQTTMLLAGANDLWQTNCPYSQGCQWRNTTNSTTCMSARVGEYQHSLAWNASNSLDIFVGNDSGLWRSTDGIGESTLAAPEPVCSATDASHFQNLNGSLGSLAEVESLSQAGATPYTMMAGLGANGTAGVKSTTAPSPDWPWPEILGGEGGPVAIDPTNSANWYVNNEPGVSIYLGTPPEGSTPGAFNAVLNYTTDPGATTPLAPGAIAVADVVRDGLSMAVEPPYAPAAFLVDPLDSSKLLIGTCRVWRGPANGVGWSAANAVSKVLDGIIGDNDCSGNALIRSIAAMPLPVSTALPAGGEVVYLGMYGSANGGATLPGHVLSLTYNVATGSWSAPLDLTLNPVTNDRLVTGALNYYGLDISSIFIDPLDTTGHTVYVTVAGLTNPNKNVQTVYGSTNGGASWEDLMANLPAAPANSVVVDPESSSTVYVATDAGVYATQQFSSCVSGSCWAQLGSGLPNAPVVALSAQPASASEPNLIAATYGRGIWMTPLLGGSGAGSGPATDTLSATSLSFSTTTDGQLSAAQYVTLTNSGSVALTLISVSVSGAFQETDPCTATLAANSRCTISVQFAPTASGAQSGTLTIQDELQTQTVALTGTGIAPPELSVSPASLSFAATVVQSTSTLPLTVTNSGGAPLAGVDFAISGTSAASFSTGSTTCGATLTNVSGQNSCTVQVLFTPATAGGATASLVVSSSNAWPNKISVPLAGTGLTTAGLNVNPAQLVFPVVAPGQPSPSQTVTITNNSTITANGLTLTATPPFNLAQTSTPCGASLAAGALCSTGVVFSPSLNGLYAGTLTVASTSLAASASVSLSGTGGVPGAVQFEPNTLVFQQTGAGLTSSAISVTITNPDGVNSLNGLTLAISTGFRLVSNGCSSTLAPLGSCTASVEFAPVSAGAQSGSLTVSSSALPGGSFLALSGMGFDFSMAPSGSSSQTIANGQIARYTLTMAPLNGSQGVFTFQCGTLPPYSSCTFNPPSEALTANFSGNVVVEIATGLTQTSARSSRPSPWPALPLVCGLVFAPFALRRRRRGLLLIALLAILAGGVTSCASSGVIAGGTVPRSGPGITPAGTYSIPVTVTANGVAQQTILTLTVD